MCIHSFRIWCAFINPKQVTFLDIRSWLFLWLNHFALLNCWEGGSWWSTRVATVFHTSPSFCFPCSKFAGTYSGIWSQMPVSANRVHTPCPYSRIKIMRDLNCLMIINLMVFLYYILSSGYLERQYCRVTSILSSGQKTEASQVKAEGKVQSRKCTRSLHPGTCFSKDPPMVAMVYSAGYINISSL